MSAADITRQALRDTADIRMREAECLLNPVAVKKGRRDGAVTCALLAVECALKVLVLQRYGVHRTSDLSEDIRKKVFSGKNGHNIANLEQHIDAAITAPSTEVRNAIAELHQTDRYEHRYGNKKPMRAHAEPKVKKARLVIDWMKELTQ